MSCLPGTPCFGKSNNTVYPRGCGIDPCYAYKTSTDLTFYTGPNLSCIEVGTCDNLTQILQKIDFSLCPENIAQAFFSAIQTNQTLYNTFCSFVNQCIPTPTTTTTSTTSTTSTTTTQACGIYTIVAPPGAKGNYEYIDCNTQIIIVGYAEYVPGNECTLLTDVTPGTLTIEIGSGLLIEEGDYCSTTTTTTLYPCDQYTLYNPDGVSHAYTFQQCISPYAEIGGILASGECLVIDAVIGSISADPEVTILTGDQCSTTSTTTTIA